MSSANEYADIINLPHHVSSKRPQMSMLERAAQFSPFAALSGFDSAITETARLTDQRITLDEYEIETLNERLMLIAQRLEEAPEVVITYFQPDERKTGGEYVTVPGVVKKIDELKGQVIFTDGTVIPINEIISVAIN